MVTVILLHRMANYPPFVSAKRNFHVFIIRFGKLVINFEKIVDEKRVFHPVVMIFGGSQEFVFDGVSHLGVEMVAKNERVNFTASGVVQERGALCDRKMCVVINSRDAARSFHCVW